MKAMLRPRLANRKNYYSRSDYGLWNCCPTVFLGAAVCHRGSFSFLQSFYSLAVIISFIVSSANLGSGATVCIQKPAAIIATESAPTGFEETISQPRGSLLLSDWLITIAEPIIAPTLNAIGSLLVESGKSGRISLVLNGLGPVTSHPAPLLFSPFPSQVTIVLAIWYESLSSGWYTTSTFILGLSFKASTSNFSSILRSPCFFLKSSTPSRALFKSFCNELMTFSDSASDVLALTSLRSDSQVENTQYKSPAIAATAPNTAATTPVQLDMDCNNFSFSCIRLMTVIISLGIFIPVAIVVIGIQVRRAAKR